MKTHKTKIKLALWAIIKNGKPEFSNMDKQRVRWFCEKKEGLPVRVEFAVQQKAKSEELLGFYFAGVIPAYIANKKFNLTQEQLDANPLLLREWCKEKKIKKAEIDDIHKMFMFEMSPAIVFDLKGKPHRAGRSLAEMGQEEAMTHIAAVFQYMGDNGFPVPNSEEFKNARDTCGLILEKGL